MDEDFTQTRPNDPVNLMPFHHVPSCDQVPVSDMERSSREDVPFVVLDRHACEACVAVLLTELPGLISTHGFHPHRPACFLAGASVVEVNA